MYNLDTAIHDLQVKEHMNTRASITTHTHYKRRIRSVLTEVLKEESRSRRNMEGHYAPCKRTSDREGVRRTLSHSVSTSRCGQVTYSGVSEETAFCPMKSKDSR